MPKTKKHFQKPGAGTTTTGKGKRGQKRKGMCLEDRPLLEPNAAGIDIGAREIYVAVPPDRDEHPVRIFSTFTEDLEKMAEWLVGSPRWRWNPPGCTGFRPTMCWNNTG
jgi:hypothetical protein